MPEPPAADALLASLLAMPPGDGAGLSSFEVAERLRVTVKTALQRLKKLQREGRLEMGTRYEPALNGRMQPIPVYRIKSAA